MQEFFQLNNYDKLRKQKGFKQYVVLKQRTILQGLL